jgi:hypothetical protein
MGESDTGRKEVAEWLRDAKRYIAADDRYGLPGWQEQLVDWLHTWGRSDIADSIRRVHLGPFQEDTDLWWIERQQIEGLRHIAELLEAGVMDAPDQARPMRHPYLPFDVKRALIEVCGRAFWYKHLLFDVFTRAGIPEQMFLRYQAEPKFTIARQLLADLERLGDDGFLLQRRLVTELSRFRTLPDDAVPDVDCALDALRALKELVTQHDLTVEDERQREQRAAARGRAETERVTQRQQRLTELSRQFAEMLSAGDYQGRGYGLEDLVEELFELFHIRYRKPYRTATEQIDGAFHFNGFDYLVETRWRKDQATLDDLLAFKGKVDRKIESTRGLFISISGFRGEVDEHLRQAPSANLILMDGYDLTLILEGRIQLTDALQVKADKAFQEGRLLFPLAELLKGGQQIGSNTTAIAMRE